ncbi:hypothetical protein HDU96_004275 [Phlyctochytrium bullatum]|nr:hypothetical protein HDU96_004275 [Phlyctochytrium bullatum]
MPALAPKPISCCPSATSSPSPVTSLANPSLLMHFDTGRPRATPEPTAWASPPTAAFLLPPPITTLGLAQASLPASMSPSTSIISDASRRRRSSDPWRSPALPSRGFMDTPLSTISTTPPSVPSMSFAASPLPLPALQDLHLASTAAAALLGHSWLTGPDAATASMSEVLELPFWPHPPPAPSTFAGSSSSTTPTPSHSAGDAGSRCSPDADTNEPAPALPGPALAALLDQVNVRYALDCEEFARAKREQEAAERGFRQAQAEAQARAAAAEKEEEDRWVRLVRLGSEDLRDEEEEDVVGLTLSPPSTEIGPEASEASSVSNDEAKRSDEERAVAIEPDTPEETRLPPRKKPRGLLASTISCTLSSYTPGH